MLINLVDTEVVFLETTRLREVKQLDKLGHYIILLIFLIGISFLNTLMLIQQQHNLLKISIKIKEFTELQNHYGLLCKSIMNFFR
jgi:hypothetical protein